MSLRFRAFIALSLVFLFLFTFIPKEVSAFPYRVEGYLKDSQGIPIPSAEIRLTGEIFDYDEIQDYIELVQTRYTDNTGYFRFDIGVAPLSPDGYVPPVIVSYETDVQEVSKSIDLEGLNTWTNLTYEEPTSAIDLLFSPIGIVAIVILISIAFAGFYIYRPKDESMKANDSDRAGRRRQR